MNDKKIIQKNKFKDFVNKKVAENKAIKRRLDKLQEKWGWDLQDLIMVADF